MSLIRTIRNYLVPYEKAKILNDNGILIDSVALDEKSNTFQSGGRAYNIDRERSYKEIKSGLIWSTTFYYYNVSNPNPFVAKKDGWEPLIDSKLYDKFLEAEVLIKLNTVKKGMFDNIKMEHIFLAIGVLIVLYFVFIKGG